MSDITRTAGPRAATPASTAAGAGPPDTSVAAGSIIRGRYRLEQLLGAGAMGQVWKARDLLLEEARDPRPHVAIKLLVGAMRERADAHVALQREAGKARSLAHPNIATVYTFDVDPGSRLAFMAMELLDGEPLDQLIRAQPDGLPRDRALTLIRGLASGLAYAHRRGIVHCDFKPGNAFAARDDVAKILDFGIARLANEVERAQDSFDAGRFSALTPRYATREMLRGGQPDPADDVFALGLVSYELLAGRHPYAGRPADVAAAQGLKPQALGSIGRRRWRAIERSLVHERERRWPHAQAFLDAFDGVGPWIPALAALTATFAVAAGYAGWVGYQKSRPDLPFTALPAEVQERFRGAMSLGDYAYDAGTVALVGSEALALLYDALAQYAEAYSLHPRNPDAEQALERALAAFGGQLEASDAQARANARRGLQSLVEQHPALAQYAPLSKLIDDLE